MVLRINLLKYFYTKNEVTLLAPKSTLISRQITNRHVDGFARDMQGYIIGPFFK